MLDIGAILVPGDEPMNGKAVTQIVQARLMSWVVVLAHNAGPDTETAKGILGILPCYRVTAAGQEERRVGVPAAQGGVGGQNAAQIATNRHQPCLVKFALANEQDACVKVDIGQCQSEGFTDAEP